VRAAVAAREVGRRRWRQCNETVASAFQASEDPRDLALRLDAAGQHHFMETTIAPIVPSSFREYISAMLSLRLRSRRRDLYRWPNCEGRVPGARFSVGRAEAIARYERRLALFGRALPFLGMRELGQLHIDMTNELIISGDEFFAQCTQGSECLTGSRIGAHGTTCSVHRQGPNE
jgi:hypothetical protein